MKENSKSSLGKLAFQRKTLFLASLQSNGLFSTPVLVKLTSPAEVYQTSMCFTSQFSTGAKMMSTAQDIRSVAADAH